MKVVLYCYCVVFTFPHPLSRTIWKAKKLGDPPSDVRRLRAANGLFLVLKNIDMGEVAGPTSYMRDYTYWCYWCPRAKSHRWPW